VAVLVKLIAPVVVVGAVGTVAVAPRVMAARQHSVPSTMTTALAPAPAESPTTTTGRVEEEVATAQADEPDGVPSIAVGALPSAPANTARQGAAHSPPKSGSSMPTEAARDDEARLVADIDVALRSGDAARAILLADDHQRRFPNGLLVEEREGSRVLAHCVTAPNPAAATGFLRAHPRSPMRARIVAACGTGEVVDEPRGR
jgi:hypothetical protein